MDGAAGSHADHVLHAVKLKQFVHVDRQRGLPHSRSLNGNTLSFIRSRKTEHAAHFVVAFGTFQKRFGYKLRAQRIPRQQHRLCYLTFFCRNMRTHRTSEFKGGALRASRYFRCRVKFGQQPFDKHRQRHSSQCPNDHRVQCDLYRYRDLRQYNQTAAD